MCVTWKCFFKWVQNNYRSLIVVGKHTHTESWNSFRFIFSFWVYLINHIYIKSYSEVTLWVSADGLQQTAWWLIDNANHSLDLSHQKKEWVDQSLIVHSERICWVISHPLRSSNFQQQSQWEGYEDASRDILHLFAKKTTNWYSCYNVFLKLNTAWISQSDWRHLPVFMGWGGCW